MPRHDDDGPARALYARLDEYEADARRELLELAKEAERDHEADIKEHDGDDPHSAGWGAMPNAKPTARQEQRHKREAKREGAEQFARQVLDQCMLTRRSVEAGNAIHAALHGLLAGHSHGAMHYLLSETREQAATGAEGGKLGWKPAKALPKG